MKYNKLLGMFKTGFKREKKKVVSGNIKSMMAQAAKKAEMNRLQRELEMEIGKEGGR